MATLVQGIQPFEWLITEAPGGLSRSQATVTVAGAVALPNGTVLGKITATGKYVKHNAGAADGSQTAAAVLGTSLEGVNGDYQALIFDTDMQVFGAMLNNGTGVAVQAKADLLTKNIKVR